MPDMLGAIYIGLSGMNAYSTGLQTISNNVANLNSSGFKTTDVSFRDLFSYGGGEATSNGSTPGATGRGVRVADPLTDFKQGDLRQTGNALDLAIQGEGFLTLLNDDKTFYTRTGQFTVDKDGYLTEQASGYHLAVFDKKGHPTSLNLDGKRTSAPAATTKIVFADNLSSSATEASVTDIAVYDDRGGKQVWTVSFARATDASAAAGDWTVTVKDQTGRTVGTSTLKFTGSSVDPSTATITITDKPKDAKTLSVVLDFSNGVTSFSGGTNSTLRAASVDGNGTGALTSVTIDEDGQVKLGYSNEKTELEGAVAIADFDDPQALKRVSGGLYESVGRAPDRLLASGVDGIGELVPQQIEASNVDLSAEFGDLILIQRGFQASSQVISTANDMIQQLFGIRGQG